MAVGHLIDRGVVQIAAGPEVLGHEALAVRQGLANLRHRARAEHVGQFGAADHDIRNRRAVDVELVGDHLHLVARQADHALDVVGLVVARQLEHHDVAARRILAQDAAVEQRRAPRDRVFRIAIGPLRHDDVVALVEVGLHRGRRNGEGLEQQHPQHEGDQQGEDDGLDDLDRLVARGLLFFHTFGFLGTRRGVDRRVAVEGFGIVAHVEGGVAVVAPDRSLLGRVDGRIAGAAVRLGVVAHGLLESPAERGVGSLRRKG
ncbi:hypothetical protein D3C85_1020540 [compost metagenome]